MKRIAQQTDAQDRLKRDQEAERERYQRERGSSHRARTISPKS
jgi:hypothetical protein